MKAILTTLGLALITGLALGDTEPLSSVVERGLFEEEVNRDFDAAIAAYESAVEQFDHDRDYAATAIFRLAENHRRAGRTDEAEPLYERVVREFHGYPELVESAAGRLPEDRLAALGAAGAPVDEEQQEIERLTHMLQNSPDLFYGGNHLHDAIEEGHLKVAEFLIEQGLSLTVPNNRGYTPLRIAVEKGSKSAVELLLTNGADVMSRSSNFLREGWTPLHFAAFRGYLAIAEVLVENSADVDAVSVTGTTPLQLAAADDHVRRVQLVRFLLERGADVNAETVKGWTALYGATQHDNFEVAQLLLEQGADVNAVYEDGATPLHRAIENANLRMIELFLERGAEVNALDDRRQSPLDYLPQDAPITAAQEISELLSQHGATEGKHYAQIRMPRGRGEDQHVYWEGSETMTLTRALTEAGINVDENPVITLSRPGESRPSVRQARYQTFLESEGEDVELEHGSVIQVYAR